MKWIKNRDTRDAIGETAVFCFLVSCTIFLSTMTVVVIYRTWWLGV